MTSLVNSILSFKLKILQPKTAFSNTVRLDHGKLDPPAHKVNKLEKRFLVWTGKYKTVEDVPNFVTQAVMERARNRMRIRIANYMMIATVIGCIVMVYSGKQAAKRGETIQKESIEWHKKLAEERK